MRLPAWWLLDNNFKLVASVRADSRDQALEIFHKDGIKGRYIYRAPKSGLLKDAPGLLRLRKAAAVQSPKAGTN